VVFGELDEVAVGGGVGVAGEDYGVAVAGLLQGHQESGELVVFYFLEFGVPVEMGVSEVESSICLPAPHLSYHYLHTCRIIALLPFICKGVLHPSPSPEYSNSLYLTKSNFLTL
jgi:hypothetical protein